MKAVDTMRVRCQVLKVIAIHDGITSTAVVELLPELNAARVQKAIYNLLQQDRVRKIGTVPRIGSKGRAEFIYECCEDYEPSHRRVNSKKRNRVIRREKGLPEYTQELQSTPTYVDRSFAHVKYRDRKIRLIKSMLPNYADASKDLLIGMLADYGDKL